MYWKNLFNQKIKDKGSYKIELGKSVSGKEICNALHKYLPP